MINYFIEKPLLVIKDIEKITNCNRMTLIQWRLKTNSLISETQGAKFYQMILEINLKESVHIKYLPLPKGYPQIIFNQA